MFDCVLLLVHYTPMSSTKVQCSATPWKVTSLPVVTGCGARKLHGGSCSRCDEVCCRKFSEGLVRSKKQQALRIRRLEYCKPKKK